MKTTGIVRRIDDLGRIVIPKEVRRAMRLKEGDPLEIFLEEDGVCFKKYHPYDKHEWDKANRILAPIINHYAILDGYGDCVKSNGIHVKTKEEAEARTDVVIHHITIYGNSLAYLIVSKDSDDEKVRLASSVLRNYLEDDNCYY